MGKGARALLKVIRAYCLTCCPGQKREVRLCPAKECTLWQYRMGKRPQMTPGHPQNGIKTQNPHDSKGFGGESNTQGESIAENGLDVEYAVLEPIL